MGRTLAEKVWEAAPGAQGRGRRARPALHRPAPGARGHQPAGVRRAAPGRAAGAPARPHARHRGPQRPHRSTCSPPIADPVSRTAGGDAAQELRGVRRPALPDEPRRAGHRARRRPAARAHPAGHDRGLRRQRTPPRTARSARMAFGIGTSEVEHVLATQTLPLKPFKTMAINVNVADGRLRPGVTSKDVILAIIAQIGTGGGQGYVLEYRGNVIENLSMEARMTICNMSIEAGARAGHDRAGRHHVRVPEGPRPRAAGADWDAAVADVARAAHRRRRGVRRRGAHRRRRAHPVRHLGHQPRPGPAARRAACRTRSGSSTRTSASRPRRRWPTWGWRRARRCATSTSTRCSSAPAPTAGSRTCAPPPRSSTGRKVADGVRMLVVPGSMRVRFQAEEEGLDKVFTAAGAEWRSAGCSMCLGMNPDQLAPGERSASTSNRNFEGRQGKGGRTHLVSPLVAAATAVRGTLSSPEDLELMDAVHHPHRHRRAAAPVQRGHRPDHPGRVPQARHPHRVRGRPVLGLARRRVVRAQHRAVRPRARCWWRAPTSAPARSREHAVWALLDYGFRVVISSRFADIFRGNSAKAGPAGRAGARSPTSSCCGSCWRTQPGTEVTVDLAEKTVQAADLTVPFEIDDYTRWRLLEGLDDIGLTLRHADAITAFEERRPARLPVTTS